MSGVTVEKKMNALELSGFVLGIVRGNAFRLLLMVLVAAALGYAINLLRPHPLPLIYESPKERLERTVQSKAAPTAFTPKDIEKIDAQRLRELQANGALVLDARPSLFYRTGHIPGALRLSAASFEQDYASLQPRLEQAKELPVIVYCSGENCEDSELVTKALARMGFGRLYILSGGWKAWQSAGLPQARE